MKAIGRAREYVLPDRGVGPAGPDILEVMGLAEGARAGGVVFFRGAVAVAVVGVRGTGCVVGAFAHAA